MLKERLRTPGPTEIPERVHRAMYAPALHHRSAEFRAIFKEVQEGMSWLMDCDSAPLFLSCSGTGAMEAALGNVCSAGERVIVAHAGKFGERFKLIAERLNLEVISLEADWDQVISAQMVEQALTQHQGVKAVCLQYSETSTGILHPVSEIGPRIKTVNPEVLFVVDAISALGTAPISVKADKVDCLIGSSQKGLMLPPGLSMIGLSEQARSRLVASSSFYFDLATEAKHQGESSSAWTPAISLLLGLNEVIQMLRSEGLERAYERHIRMSVLTRAGLEALGCKTLAKASPAPAVTPALPPDGVDSEELRSELKSTFGIQIAGAQQSYKGKVFRIGHMGYVDELDALSVISALELSLAKLTSRPATGEGVAAALKTLNG